MPAGLIPVSAKNDAPEVDMLMHDKAWVAGLAMAVGLACAAPGYGQTAGAAPQAAPVAKAPAAKQAAAGRQAGLNLTDAQREQIRTLRDAQRNDDRALREKMRAAREQLRQTMRADVPDEAAVRAAAGAVAALQADQAALRARSRAQFMKVLTPDQQARMKEARARAAQRVQRAQRAQRVQRQMRLNRMMRQGQGPGRGMGPAGAPMGRPMTNPRLRQQMLRQWRWWI
jgi:Spy/CpxP family protein refolding chaperone